MTIQEMRLFVSNLIKQEGISTEQIESFAKLNNSLEEVENTIAEKEKQIKELQVKYGEAIMKFPVSSEAQKPADEVTPKSLEEVIQETILARNKVNNFNGG